MFERTSNGRQSHGNRWGAGRTQAIGLAAVAAAAIAGAGFYWNHDTSPSGAAAGQVAQSASGGATAERPLPLRGLVEGMAAPGGAREGNGPATADELVGGGFVVVTAAGRVQGLPYTGGGAFLPTAMP
jgi:hypothetical protein